MRSDHRPILLQVGCQNSPNVPRQFRYFSGWLSHEDFPRMVRDNWQPSQNMSDTITSFVHAADVWNSTVFGYIGTKKRMLMARLRGIQRALNSRPSRFLINLEAKLLINLENLLDQEELLWKQKACAAWISLGDRNTSYFHRRAIYKKQRSRISSLKLHDSSWCDDPSILKEEVVRFFESLFSTTDELTPIFPNVRSFHSLPSASLAHLDQPPSPSEIHDALKDMAPLKSPGWDGLHVEFFQSQWSIVGPSIYAMIHNIFTGGTIEPRLNNTVLVLIPKSDKLETFIDFRSISLCTVLYKLLTKIIVRRLKPLFPKIISQCQTSFISGRSITENIIVNHEVIHSMGSCKSKHGWMAIKVDLEKAFDRL
ncbi:hypothetical protein like AT1G43760 [Hibiscus trionum]|uniref:Reverse transcriptase domain-containing protein n=1 Tax=Hibiscus trionum TaxID=183268 RepID=A0A9W7HD44_HIBTR|nr:hypothetical protein like AT1G43760 [Hibiscus trionum]